jgi:uncharacterized membrane protein
MSWRSLGFTGLDLAAVLWFFLWWLGYARFAEWRAKRVPSLLSVMARYRRDWWVRTIERELRMIDTSIIANLSNSSTFFASTTLLILGGLLALLGTTEKVVQIVQGLPFQARATTPELWEIKILLLVAIFVYAFFKFTWSLRQFNMASVLVGAAPKVPRDPDDEADYIDRASSVSHFAAEQFNYGLRAYYFALAALAWFLNGWLFMAGTTWVVLVLYWREFRSQTLERIRRKV